jgi:hypothetical protein
MIAPVEGLKVLNCAPSAASTQRPSMMLCATMAILESAAVWALEDCTAFI